MKLDATIPFLTHFSCVPDPRVERTKRHALVDILFMSVCAVLCGANDCVAIADFAAARIEWLRQFVDMANGAPSHDTISRVLRLVNPIAFERAFLEWTETIRDRTSGDILPIDGKVLRGSFDKATGIDAIDMVTAWSSANGIVLGQVKTDVKSNEITAIPNLLKMLDIEGCIITIDAMGTQKKIAEQIIEQKGDYLLAVKANQPNLQQDLVEAFKRYRENRWMDGNADDIPHDYIETVDTGHGRTVTRRCWCTNVMDGITSAPDWTGLKTIVLFESNRDLDADGKPTIRYYITSLKPDAANILRAIRTHWQVENKLHWVLDVNFREDQNRTRKGFGAQVRSMLNRIAINLCKTNTTRKAATSRKRNMASWDESFLFELITNKEV